MMQLRPHGLESTGKNRILSGEIWDLHCDLPMSLLQDGAHPSDCSCACSLDELTQGGVHQQICAIFSFEHSMGADYALQQACALQRLRHVQSSGPQLRWALEGAVGIFPLKETVEQGFRRWEEIQTLLGPCSYVTLTWNGSCSLGGGAFSEEGLTQRGKEVVCGMIDRGIPLDMSHTSDSLAKDLLQLVDQRKPSHPILASHSNLRSLCPHPRNLPDWLAQELIQRKGLIGLNWVRPFIGSSWGDLFRHVEKILEWGGETVIASGADLFCEKIGLPPDAPRIQMPFFKELSSGKHMKNWREAIRSNFGEAIAHHMFSLNPAQFWSSVPVMQR